MRGGFLEICSERCRDLKIEQERHGRNPKLRRPAGHVPPLGNVDKDVSLAISQEILAATYDLLLVCGAVSRYFLWYMYWNVKTSSSIQPLADRCDTPLIRRTAALRSSK